MRDIPPGNIICKLRIKRFFSYKKTNERFVSHYKIIGDIEWNTKLNNQKNSPQLQALCKKITGIVNERRGKYIKIPYDNSKPQSDNFSFECVDQATHNDIHLCYQLVNLMKEMAFTTENIKSCAETFLQLAKQLNNINGMLPGRNQSLVEYMKQNQQYVRTISNQEIYANLLGQLQELANDSYGIALKTPTTPLIRFQ